MLRERQFHELIDQVRDAVAESDSLRIGLRPAHVKVLTTVLAAGVVLTILFFAKSRPQEEAVPVPDVVVTSEVVVDVAGKVVRPGVYRLNAGARAIDAITMAGGVIPGTGTENINLAHVLVDGEQILVGAKVESDSTQININTASIEQLDRLPGVGPVLAQRIVAWREAHGRFKSIESIKEVPGVGAATFTELKNLIRV